MLRAVNYVTSSKATVEEDLTCVRDHILDTSGLEIKLAEAMEKLDEIDILINNMVGGSPLKDGDRIDRLFERHEATEKRVPDINAELDDMKVRKSRLQDLLRIWLFLIRYTRSSAITWSEVSSTTSQSTPNPG